MSWTRGRRELCFSGRLPLEQGAAFEQAIWQIAKSQRALDKQTGTILDWQQSTADALSSLALNRSGFGGHFRSTRGFGHGVWSEVPAGVAGACGADGGGGSV
jgi:hypothetical protein